MLWSLQISPVRYAQELASLGLVTMHLSKCIMHPLPQVSQNSDMGLSDHTGNADNSIMVKIYIVWEGILTISVHGRFWILADIFFVRIPWVNLGGLGIHIDRCLIPLIYFFFYYLNVIVLCDDIKSADAMKHLKNQPIEPMTLSKEDNAEMLRAAPEGSTNKVLLASANKGSLNKGPSKDKEKK